MTAAYKRLTDPNTPGPWAATGAARLGPRAVDLDDYVTRKALDGLFLKIAEQEKLIRSDPAARTTDLLRQVFGTVRKGS